MDCYLMWSVIAICLCVVITAIIKGFKVSADSNKPIKIVRIVKFNNITNISNILASFNEKYNLNGVLENDVVLFSGIYEVSLTFELPKGFKLITNEDLSVCKLEQVNDHSYNLPDKI